MSLRSLLFVVLAASLVVPLSGDDSRVELSPDLYLEPLAPGVWRHVSSKEIEDFGLVPANGLLVLSGEEAALVDTPWTDDQVRLLAKWLADQQGAHLTIAVATHWHPDCLGGLGAAHELGAASYASNKTIALAKEHDAVVPENGFDGRIDLSVGALILSLEEVGAGHTVDNIVVWLPVERILFGGCLVRSGGAKSLGYTEEADLDAWPRTIDRVAARFERAEIIVPGHGDPGGYDLLAHTNGLLGK